MDEKQLQALYDAMNKRLGLGDFNQFKTSITSDDKFRKAFYDEASTELELGDYNTFEGQVKKKGILSGVGGVALQNGSQGGSSLLNGGGGVKKVEYPDTLPENEWDRKRAEREKYFSDSINQEEYKKDPLKTLNKAVFSEAIGKEINKKPISESTGQKYLSPEIKVNEENINVYNQRRLEDNLKENIFPTTQAARDWKFANGKGGVTDTDNETDLLADKVINEHEKVKAILNLHRGDIKNAAIEYYANQDPRVAEIFKAGGTPPPETVGALVGNFLRDKNVLELTEESKEFNDAYREAQFNFRKDYPEMFTNEIVQKIAQGREDYGENNPFINLVGVNSSDRVIQRLYDEKKIDDEELEHYQKVVRPQLALHLKRIPTTGFVENAFQSAEKGLTDIPKGLYDLTGIHNAITTKAERAYNELSEEANFTHVTPKTFGGTIATATGHLGGLLLPLSAGTKALAASKIMNAKTANEVMMGLTFYHDLYKDAEKNNPNGGYLNQLQALVQTTIFAKINPTFGALSKGVVTKAAPQIKEVLEKLKTESITGGQAKEGIVQAILTQVPKKTLKTSGEMMLATGVSDAVGSIFSGKYDGEQSINNMVHTFESMLLGTPLLNLASVRSNRRVMEEYLSDMGDNPTRYRGQITKLAETDPEIKKRLPELLQNLTHVEAVKKELDARGDIKPIEKKKYLLLSLQEKLLKEKADAIPDEGLKPEKQLKEIEIEKKMALDPDAGVQKEVQDFYDNDLLPKGVMEQLEVEGKFSPQKVGGFLKELAQQANNLDADWKPHEGGIKMTKPNVPESLIEIANERWKDKIPQKEEPLPDLNFDTETNQPTSKAEQPSTGLSRGDEKTKKPDVETPGDFFTVEDTKLETVDELGKNKAVQNEAKETDNTKTNSGNEVDISGTKKKTNTIGGYEFTKTPTLEWVIAEPIDKSNNAIIEKQMFVDDNKNVLNKGVKYIGGGWYEIGGDNFGSVDLYNTVSKEGVSLNHKQGGRMGVVVNDFVKNNSRYNDNIAVRGSKFTEAEHNPKFGGSGHYKGTYFYVGLNAESKALEHGKNLSKVDIEKANLYELGENGQTSQSLKNEAKKAGYDTRDASGYAESEYLKKQGYDGIKRGNEVVLFDPKKFETTKDPSLSSNTPSKAVVVDEKVVKSRVKRISKSLNVDEQRSQQIHDIALKAKDYEDFKKQVGELIGDDTVNENRIAEQYDDIRNEAKSEYEKELERNLEDLRAAYTDATLADAALKRMNEKSPKSVRGFIKRLLTGATPESVAANKARLVEMQRQYRKEKADMRAMLPRERGANFVVEKLSRAARNGDISQEAADLAIDLIRKQPDMFGDLAISITGKKGESDGVQGWYRAADALVKIFKNPSDETTVAHEVLHHTERFLPHEIRDKIIAEWNNEVNLQIADIQKKLKNETNVDKRQQLTQGLLYLGLAQERQVEPNSANQQSMERIMSKYLGDHTDSQGNFHKGLGNSWYQLYNPSEWWAVNASRLFREAKNKPELKTWTDKAKAFYNYLIDAVKRVFKGSPTAAVEKGLKTILNGEALEDREGTQLSASKKLLNIKQKGSFEDKLKSIYDEVNKDKNSSPNTPSKEQAKPQQPELEAEKSEIATQDIENQPPEPPKKPPVDAEGGSGVEGDSISITHKATADIRKEMGLKEYEKESQTVEKWRIEAEERIKKGELPDLVRKMKAGEPISEVEQMMIGQHIANLNKEASENPTKESLAKLKDIIDLSDKAGGSAWGRSGRARQEVFTDNDSLANFLLDKQVSQGTALSENQIKEESAKFTELQKAKQALSELEAADKEAYAKLVAEVGVNKARAAARKASKKSHEEHIKDRKAIVEAARADLKRIREQGLKSTIPGIQELKALVPHVKRYMQDLLNEGIDKFDNIITDIHAEFKDILDGLRKSDIVDILAGAYDEKSGQTKNEKEAAIRLIKREAALMKELSAARKGLQKAKTSRDEIKSNKRIDELTEKIKEVKRINRENTVDEIPTEQELLSDFIDKMLKRADKLASDIKNKKYLDEKKPPPVFKKSRKAQIAEDRVIDLENKIRHERSADEYRKRSKTRRFFDKVMEVLGVKRLVQSAVDISVPFRQGVTLLSPRKIDVWLKGFKANLQSVFNPKKFNRIMYEIRHDPMYHDMVKDKVVFNDLGAADPNLHNEDFRKSFVYKIPIISEPLKASNRSADAFLNVARYEMYKKGRANLERQGLTRESDPTAYTHLGNWVMSMTGRGRMTNMLENSVAHTVLGNTFYGARLMASRFNLLNPVTYFDPRVPRQQKIEAMKDMASFTTTIMVTGLALAAAGGVISLDPDDPDFLKIRFGGKVYDISGGLSNYVRTFLRIGKAGYVRATGTKEEGKKATDRAFMSTLNFFRNKLAPNTAYATDAFFGPAYGQEFDPSAIYRIYPMYTDDALKALKEEGVISLATVLLPNILGIGYSNYPSKDEKKNQDLTKEEKEDPTFKYFIDKGIDFPELDPKKIITKKRNDKVVEHLSDLPDKVEDYVAAKKKYLKEEMQMLQSGQYEIYRDKNGTVHIRSKDLNISDMEYVEFDKLTKEELQHLVSDLGEKATDKTKKEVLPDE